MQRVAVGLLGLGTVGGGVARLLGEQGDRIARKAGRRIEIRRAAVRDVGRVRPGTIPADRITGDPRAVVDDPEIAIVVEVMGGIRPTLDLLLDALANGKDVVTANKALLAEHGATLFAAAREHGRTSRSRGASRAESRSSRRSGSGWRPTRCRGSPRSSTGRATSS